MTRRLLELSIYLVTSLLLCSISYTAFQTGSKEKASKSLSKAIPNDDHEYDLGVVYWGESRHQVISFVNTSSETITFTRVIAECGCTVPDDSRVGTAIAPNERVDVSVEFNPGNMEGEFAKKIFLQFRGREDYHSVFIIKGIARSPLIFTRTPIFFGTRSRLEAFFSS